jgi:hypothetical protein
MDKHHLRYAFNLSRKFILSDGSFENLAVNNRVMIEKLKEWLLRVYPMNYILKKPAAGAFTIFVFNFLFALLYKPVGAHAGSFLNYGATMAVYSTGSALMVFLAAILLKKYVSPKTGNNWNILLEAAAILVALLMMGLATYLLAFIIEPPSNRWNFATFFDSVKRTVLIGMIPFLAISMMNLRYRLLGEKVVFSSANQPTEPVNSVSGKPIRIISQLKKETLEFLPDQFVYAESDGNYVNFYLHRSGKVVKEMIRNSLGNIEVQFGEIPWFFRTHRAFIVNLKKVASAKGNTLGYRLKLTGIESEIPVARNKTRDFLKLLEGIKA